MFWSSFNCMFNWLIKEGSLWLDNILLKAGAFIALSLVAFKGLSFDTNVDSQVVGADLTITEVNNDGGDLTVGGTWQLMASKMPVCQRVLLLCGRWNKRNTRRLGAMWWHKWHPNLKGRLVVGYNTDDQTITVGKTGGNDQRTLSEAIIPSHRHVQKVMTGDMCQQVHRHIQK